MHRSHGYVAHLLALALTAVTFFLFKGKYEYEITAQTTCDNWPALKGKLEAAVQTFTAN